MTANYVDLSELAADLNAAADNIEDATQDLLVGTGQKIMAEAQARVHVKTGKLKTSIRMVVRKNEVIVGPDPQVAPYGSYVEYGTGTRGEFPGAMYEIKPVKGKYLVFTVGGKKVFARSVKHPGSRAFPYMRPAAEAWVTSLGSDMARVGVMLITGHNPQAK